MDFGQSGSKSGGKLLRGEWAVHRNANLGKQCRAILEDFSLPVGWTEDNKLWADTATGLLRCYEPNGQMVLSVFLPQAPSARFCGMVAGLHVLFSDTSASVFYVLTPQRSW